LKVGWGFGNESVEGIRVCVVEAGLNKKKVDFK
jgi:hypothetical protein